MMICFGRRYAAGVVIILIEIVDNFHNLCIIPVAYRSDLRSVSCAYQKSYRRHETLTGMDTL